MKKRKLLFFTLCVVLLFCLTAVGLLTGTQTGLRFIGNTLDESMGAQLQLGEVQGRLLGKWSVENFVYSSPELSLEIKAFECQLKPWSLFLGNLHFQRLEGEGILLKLDLDQDQQKEQDSSFVFPLAVILERLSLKDLQVNHGGQTHVADSLVLSGQMDSRTLRVHSLQLDSPLNKGHLTGALQFKENRWQAEIEVEEFNPAQFNEEWPGVYHGKITGSGVLSENPEGEFKLHRLQAEVEGTSLELKGQGHYKEGSLLLTDGLLTRGGSQFLFSGMVGEQMDLRFGLQVPNFQDIMAEAGGEVELKGQLTGPLTGLELAVDFRGDSLTFQEHNIETLRGKLVARLSDTSRLEGELQVKEVKTGGQVYRDNSLRVAGTLESHRLMLNLGPELGRLALLAEGGYLQERWRGVVETFEFQFPQEKQWTLTKRAGVALSATSANLEQFCLEHEQEKLCVLGSWLAEPMTWSGKLNFENLDPTAITPEWAGDVSGEIVGRGEKKEKSFHHRVEIRSLSGRAAQAPVNGSGRLFIDDNSMRLEDISLQFADSQLLVNGTVNDLLDLTFSAGSPDLSKASSALGGTLQIKGSVKGPRAEPRANLDFQLDKGEIAGAVINQLKGTIDLDLAGDGNVVTRITGKALQAEGFMVEEASFQIKGSRQKHSLRLDVTSEQGELKMHGSGKLQEQRWVGMLQKLDLGIADIGNWKLQGVPQLQLAKEEVKVSRLCLAGEGGDGCLDGQWQSSAPWHLQLRATNLALGPLMTKLVPAFPLKGRLRSSIEASGSGGVPQSANIEISLPEGSVTLTTEEEKQYTLELEANKVNLQLADEVLEATAEVGTKKGSRIGGELKMGGLNKNGLKAFLDQTVKGKLDLEVKDLSVLNNLTDFFIKASGGLHGGFIFTGPLRRPELDGDVLLKEGELAIPSVGLVLHNLTASLIAQGDKLKLLCGSKTEDGYLKGEGEFRLGEGGWQVEGQLQGSNFELVNLPEYEVFADPDIRFGVDGHGATVSGRLFIPRAHIAPTGETGGVSRSSDVVFVDEEVEETKRPMALKTDLVIELGDDVQLDSHGLKSLLKGRLAIRSIPGRGATGNGDIVLEDGTFSIYGKTFEIERGRLFYSGGPLDNPGLDVRAQKSIGETVVGVDIGGTATDYEIHLFSSPPMEERDILAYLVIGRSGPASNEDESDMLSVAAASLGLAGVNRLTKGFGSRLGVDEIHLEGGTDDKDMSIVVGKNITEDLFIGYDHDFFNSTGEFRVRYKLGKGFYLETRSSAVSTSGDLFFSIER